MSNYTSLIERLKRPVCDGSFDPPTQDELHMAAACAIEDLERKLASFVGNTFIAEEYRLVLRTTGNPVFMQDKGDPRDWAAAFPEVYRLERRAFGAWIPT